MDFVRGIDFWGGIKAAVLFYLVKSGGGVAYALSDVDNTTQAVAHPFFDAFSNSSIAGCVYEVQQEFDSIGHAWVPCHPNDLEEARVPDEEVVKEEPETCRAEVSMRGRTRMLSSGETTLCKGVYVASDLEDRDVIIKSTRGIENPRAACHKLAEAFIRDAVMAALEAKLPEESPHNNHRTYICYGPGDCHLGGRLEDLHRRNYTKEDRAALLKHPFAVCPKTIETEAVSREVIAGETEEVVGRTYKVATVVFWSFEPSEALVREMCSNVTGRLPLANAHLYSRYGRTKKMRVHDALISALHGGLLEDSPHNDDRVYFYQGEGACDSGGRFRDLHLKNFTKTERALLLGREFTVYPQPVGRAAIFSQDLTDEEKESIIEPEKNSAIVFWAAPRDNQGVCVTIVRKVPFND